MNLLEPLVSLLYPDLCFACRKTPKHKDNLFCMDCSYKMTFSKYHLLKKNPISERFWGRVHIENACALFAFTKDGLLQNLIHQLKYQGKYEVGIELGKIYGGVLKDAPDYQDIDCIVPVPLHAKKEFIRGYNQAAMFAQGLSESMNVAWSKEHLLRAEFTTTQTQKSRMERFDNVKDAFVVPEPSAIIGKHLLLVDDVLTTGATMEACANKLLEVQGVRVSVACIGVTSSL